MGIMYYLYILDLIKLRYMRTYKTKSGEYVSYKPQFYFKGFDSQGKEVFTGDKIRDKSTNQVIKVNSNTWDYIISNSNLI